MAELNLTPVNVLVGMAQRADVAGLNELKSRCLSDTERDILSWIHRIWNSGGAISDELFVSCMDFITSLGWHMTSREFELLTSLGALTDSE